MFEEERTDRDDTLPAAPDPEREAFCRFGDLGGVWIAAPKSRLRSRITFQEPARCLALGIASRRQAVALPLGHEATHPSACARNPPECHVMYTKSVIEAGMLVAS